MRMSLEGYALALAAAASSRSEDPHRQVGAVVLGAGGAVLATGYNGPPSGVDLAPGEWADRRLARLYSIHAEANALRFVRPGEGALLASTLQPCDECVKAARAQGVTRVVFAEWASARWFEHPGLAARLGVSVERVAP